MQVCLWPEIRGRCSSEVRATCFQREPLPGQQWRGLAGKAEEEVKRREQGERAPAAGKPQMMVVMGPNLLWNKSTKLAIELQNVYK